MGAVEEHSISANKEKERKREIFLIFLIIIFFVLRCAERNLGKEKTN